jgi:hypothetical protein
VAATRIVEAVDVFEDLHLSVSTYVPCVPPDPLRLDGCEERFNGSIIIAISLAAHRHFKVMLAQDLLVVMGTVLAAADVLLSVKQRSEFDLSVCEPKHIIPLFPKHK